MPQKHFTLFFPRIQRRDPGLLEEYGLGELLSLGPEFVDVTGGPLGPGMLVAWGSGGKHAPSLEVSDRQTWSPLSLVEEDGDKQFFIGWDKDCKPGPEALRRPKDQLQGGPMVKLGDGNMWMVPELLALPQTYRLDKGKWEGQVSPEYREFCEQGRGLAEEIIQAALQLIVVDRELVGHEKLKGLDTKVDFTLSEACDFACQALAINYHLCPVVASAIGILDDPGIVAIVAASVGVTTDLMEVADQKKTRDHVSIPIGPVTSSGA